MARIRVWFAARFAAEEETVVEHPAPLDEQHPAYDNTPEPAAPLDEQPPIHDINDTSPEPAATLDAQPDSNVSIPEPVAPLDEQSPADGTAQEPAIGDEHPVMNGTIPVPVTLDETSDADAALPEATTLDEQSAAQGTMLASVPLDELAATDDMPSEPTTLDALSVTDDTASELAPVDEQSVMNGTASEPDVLPGEQQTPPDEAPEPLNQQELAPDTELVPEPHYERTAANVASLESMAPADEQLTEADAAQEPPAPLDEPPGNHGTAPEPVLVGEPPVANVTSPELVTLDPERQVQARRYARQKQVLMLVNLAISAALIAVILISGLSFGLRDGLMAALGSGAGWIFVSAWHPVLVAAYFAVLFAAVFVVDLPLSYFSGFVLPHRYGLSTQTLGGWALDLVKGLVLSLVFELLAVEFVYFLLAATPNTWWVWTAIAVLVVAVLLSNLAPILLLPLFYKLTPLPEGEVREKVLALARRAGTRVRGVYSMNMSAKTTAANAAVMGLGNTRRIVVGDTLLDRYTPDEIEVVLAHELGHQVHHDIPKLITVQTAVTLLTLYLTNVVLHVVVAAFPRYQGLADAATMPLLGATLGVLSLLLLPIANGFSRHVEHQADVYALDLTGKREAFISAMSRLANQNLAELQPSPVVEFLLYDHPSVGQRLAFAKSWVAPTAGQ